MKARHVTGRLARLAADTLGKRLFLLMWLTLVASHLAAWALVSAVFLRGASFAGMPVLPSLPPTPGLPGLAVPPSQPHGPPRRPPPGEPGFERGPGPPPGVRDGPPPRAPDRRPTPGLPPAALALDYGIRLLLIGLSSWIGARWLSRPMRRLVGAADELARSLGSDRPPPSLDERSGTVEVRESARVFNRMAHELDEQFRSRGLMIAAISHDLRTPLTRLRMRLESLPPGDLVDRCAGDIREMNALIESVVEIFDPSAALERLEPTDVHALVQSIVDDLAEQGQPVSYCGAPLEIQTHPIALRRIVQNLIGNALRYGGRADVSIDVSPAERRIVVDDDGPGIPADELAAVFEPFYRVEASRNRASGGTGLGLFIARDLSRKQGAELRLANRPAGGLRAEIVWAA